MRALGCSLLLQGTAATLLLTSASGRAEGQDGAQIFRNTCQACHSIGGGRIVGPDLAGVGERRDEAWLIRFVQHSQAVIKSGDSTAVALAAEYQGLSMPDWPLSDAEVRAVLAYIAATTASAPATASASAPAATQPITGDPELGRLLFQGSTRFANGGPSCNSCHNVAHEDVIGGGVLAKDLTTVFSRLGGQGVRSVVGSPPFPVMQRAFQDRPLTEQEVNALVAFFEQTDVKASLHQPLDYGIRLFVAGVLGAALLLGFYSLAWRKRKRSAVNAGIHKRLIRST